jgi:uncharacterized membrane protein HdeD (DUF308 family)
MFDQLIRRWWIVAARGIVAVTFGIVAFIAPEKTLGWLVAFFGFFALADGIFTMGAGLSLSWLSLFLEGFVGGAVGLATFFFPPIAQAWFVYLIIAWALVTGVLELVAALRLRRIVDGPMVTGEWLLGVSGVLSLLFGAAVGLQPAAAGVSLTLIIGAYAIASGVLLLALALNIRMWRQLVPPRVMA